MCASVCLCFECVFLGRSCVLVCVFVPGACVCWRLDFPKRVVRRFVLIRRRRKERSVPHRVARGTHGYSRGPHGVLTGIHGVLEKSSRTESTQGYSGVLEGPSIPRAIPAHHTLHRHGVSSPVQSVTHPSSMHSSHKHAHSPSLSRSLPPSLSCGLLACFPRHLCCGAGRWRERRTDRRGACPCLGVLVPYMWGSMVLAHSATTA